MKISLRNRGGPIQIHLDNFMSYNKDTGIILWKPRSLSWFKTQRDCNAWNTRFANKEALSNIDTKGYKNGVFFGKRLKAHRVAWFLYYRKWPNIIDHIDGNRINNKIVNLRDCGYSQNQMNRSPKKRGSSKYKGLSRVGARWQVSIGLMGKKYYIGKFKDEEEAAIAYDKKAKELFGEFAKLNFGEQDES